MLKRVILMFLFLFFLAFLPSGCDLSTTKTNPDTSNTQTSNKPIPTIEEKYITITAIPGGKPLNFEIPQGKLGINIKYSQQNSDKSISSDLKCQIFSITENKEYCKAPLPPGKYLFNIKADQVNQASLIIELDKI